MIGIRNAYQMQLALEKQVCKLHFMYQFTARWTGGGMTRHLREPAKNPGPSAQKTEATDPLSMTNIMVAKYT